MLYTHENANYTYRPCGYQLASIICYTRLSKNGVLIPYQNVKNLTLSDEVIQAVKEGTFHIYPISTIDEGIEILTGVPAGKKDKDGKFPAGTVNYLVYEKLKKYAKV